MSSAPRKFLRELKRKALEMGVQVIEIEQRKSSHFAITFRDGVKTFVVTTSNTPTNEHFVVNNILRDVRRIKEGRYGTST